MSHELGGYAVTDIEHPETRFTSVGHHRVAYRVSGTGPLDMIMSPGFWSHMELIREDPGHVNFRHRMQTFCRLIGFDSLGTGLSDRPRGGIADEYWIESCAAVLEATSAPAPVIVSLYVSGPVVLEFVRRFPQCCSGLIFVNTYACWARRADYVVGASNEEIEKTKQFMAMSWGEEGYPVPSAPSQANNEEFLRWNASIQRAISSAEAVLHGLARLEDLDSREVLPQIRVPTLVMGRAGLSTGAYARAKYIADNIPNARFVELPGSDVAPFYETPELILNEIEEFSRALVA